MPSEADNTKMMLMYAIIKQLNLKSIDWQAVGAELDISSIAASTRWYRLNGELNGTPVVKNRKDSSPQKRKKKPDAQSKPGKKQKQNGKKEIEANGDESKDAATIGKVEPATLDAEAEAAPETGPTVKLEV